MLPLIVVFLSGFAALLYQVVWQRLLVFFSGADVYSVTLIVAAFMGGLGAGSLSGGHLADRLTRRQCLLAFAAAELCVAVFGSVSKPLYYDTLYTGYAHLAATPAIAAVVLFLTLLVPTFLMGLSLPLLSRACARTLLTTPHVIGRLYGVNTLGAAAGAFTATWMLVPRFGLERSLWVAVAANVVCAALAAALAAAPTVDVDTGDTSELATPPSSSPPAQLPFTVWVAIYGLTGFVALGLEIAWFRVLGVLLKSTAFTFGTLLAVYLCGLGAGAAIGARLCRRSRRAGAQFLGLQYGVTLYTALSTTLMVGSLAAGRPIKLLRFLAGYDPVDVYGVLENVATTYSLTPLRDFLVLYLVVPAVLIGPPTFLMGMSFPYLQKATQVDFPRLGRRLGTLLATNIAGGVLGAIAVGWLLLPSLGTAGTLQVLVATGALLSWPYARLRWPGNQSATSWTTVTAASVSIVALVTMPNGAGFWAPLHATTRDHVLVDEDGAGLSLAKLDQESGARLTHIYVNGVGQSWVPYGNIHTVLGALPAFIHTAPADVAIIGLGSGDTAFAAAGRAELRRLVSIEILGAQRRTLERLAEARPYAGLSALLTDPRIEHRIGDGRAYLVRSTHRFDIIEADALRPSSAYAGNLYSREYFALLLSRLAPSGLAVTWAPTERIRATFVDVFPHVVAFKNGVYVGSNAPIPVDAEVILARAAGAHDYYHAAGIDIVALLREYLEPAPPALGPGDPRRTTALNTDMFARDEFALPFW